MSKLDVMQAKVLIAPGAVVLAVISVVTWAARDPVLQPADLTATPSSDLSDIVAELDEAIAANWDGMDIPTAESADDLTVMRRLSLSLHGMIPSLEEIRAFEADDRADRLDRWTARMLADRRFADYFAERLARAFVGTEEGQFIVYRRDRFVDWLADELADNRPYDEIVRTMIAEDGLWTGNPATNFVTVAFLEGDFDENKLAGRTARAFLGQSMDCAQCHDHPFADWTQDQFEGLAAFYGQTRLSPVGIEEKREEKREVEENGRTVEKLMPVEYRVEDRDSLEMRVVSPDPPFHREWLPEGESRRARLAAWVTHPENRRFERAIVNRVWGYLFGRPYVLPVDDIPDPQPGSPPDVLDLLGRDFRAHGCDLRRLVRVIAGSRAFRLSSQHATATADDFVTLEDRWAVFPLTRLRPEQVIGAMLQAGSVKAIDRNSHVFVRVIRYFRERDFVSEYGDLGADELDEHSGTIPQALLRMNGKLPSEILEASPFTASGRIARFSGGDENCLESCFLVCLTRRPTAEESAAMLPQLRGEAGKDRRRAVEDIYWPLFNAPEFSWNH